MRCRDPDSRIAGIDERCPARSCRTRSIGYLRYSRLSRTLRGSWTTPQLLLWRTGSHYCTPLLRVHGISCATTFSHSFLFPRVHSPFSIFSFIYSLESLYGRPSRPLSTFDSTLSSNIPHRPLIPRPITCSIPDNASGPAADDFRIPQIRARAHTTPPSRQTSTSSYSTSLSSNRVL